MVSPFYKTRYGKAYLGDTLNIISSWPDNSINLIFTSPPFALTRKKEYGNEQETKYIQWFLQFIDHFKRILTDDGSLVIEFGGTYLPGSPTRSIYQYDLLCRLVKEYGFFLAQEFFHYNAAVLPSPAEWVCIRRVRTKDSIKVLWWLSKSQFPKANNKEILQPYSKAMLSLIRNGCKTQTRPSGHQISTHFTKDNGGAIPSNVLQFNNTESNSKYLVRCKEANLKPHPARFPKKLPEFFIKFLTEEGDTVFDPFAGSNTTGEAAEDLKRKWLACEIQKNYLETSKFRFE